MLRFEIDIKYKISKLALLSAQKKIWRLILHQIKVLHAPQGLNIVDFITRQKFNNNRVLLNFYRIKCTKIQKSQKKKFTP